MEGWSGSRGELAVRLLRFGGRRLFEVAVDGLTRPVDPVHVRAERVVGAGLVAERDDRAGPQAVDIELRHALDPVQVQGLFPLAAQRPAGERRVAARHGFDDLVGHAFRELLRREDERAAGFDVRTSAQERAVSFDLVSVARREDRPVREADEDLSAVAEHEIRVAPEVVEECLPLRCHEMPRFRFDTSS